MGFLSWLFPAGSGQERQQAQTLGITVADVERELPYFLDTTTSKRFLVIPVFDTQCRVEDSNPGQRGPSSSGRRLKEHNSQMVTS